MRLPMAVPGPVRIRSSTVSASKAFSCSAALGAALIRKYSYDSMSGSWRQFTSPEGPLRAYVAAPPQGSGPGVILYPDAGKRDLSGMADVLADDGYTVLLPGDGTPSVDHLMRILRSLPSLKGRIGGIRFGVGALQAAGLDCVAGYYDAQADAAVPTVLHLPAGPAPAAREGFEVYTYPGCKTGFATPGDPAYFKPAADMAYSRTLALLRRVLGPYYDLSSLWEAHRRCEFETRDAEATMATMVAEPYVNHIPTLTGGYGKADLHRFYKHHFIPKSPKDMRNIPVSRTVGTDRIVNEGVLCFTHDTEIDWMLPGVPPTGRYVE